MSNFTLGLSAAELKVLSDKKVYGFAASGNYGAAYEYLMAIVDKAILSDKSNGGSNLGGTDYVAGLSGMYLWFSVALHANTHDGSLVDIALRHVTQGVCAEHGVLFTDELYQLASNSLAKKLIDQIIDKKFIPSMVDICDMDSKNFSEYFNVPAGLWPGAIIDQYMLGGDVAISGDYSASSGWTQAVV